MRQREAERHAAKQKRDPEPNLYRHDPGDDRAQRP